MVTVSHKLFHYLLIILLMIAPVRGAMGMQESHCDMDVMSSEAMSSETMSSINSAAQHQTMGYELSDHESINKQTSENQKSVTNHQCCCCDGDNCAASCDMGMTVSLVMQESSYTPVFIAVTQTTKTSSPLLIRALTPPSRPPATFS